MPELNPSKSFFNALVVVLLGALFATGATISDSVKQNKAIGGVLHSSLELNLSNHIHK